MKEKGKEKERKKGVPSVVTEVKGKEKATRKGKEKRKEKGKGREKQG